MMKYTNWVLSLATSLSIIMPVTVEAAAPPKKVVTPRQAPKATFKPNTKLITKTAPILKAVASQATGRFILEPEVLASWLNATDSVTDSPPFLTQFTTSASFPVTACPVGTAGEPPGTLRRSCYNTYLVTASDSRFQKIATPENRLAVTKYYVDKFGLPYAGNTHLITADWLTRKSGRGIPGADDLNSVVAMIRYQLKLSQDEILDAAKMTESEGEKKGMSEEYRTSIRLSTGSMLFSIARERRLIDFWFPDAPAWSALLLASCNVEAERLPVERCCFRKLRGCNR